MTKDEATTTPTTALERMFAIHESEHPCDHVLIVEARQELAELVAALRVAHRVIMPNQWGKPMTTRAGKCIAAIDLILARFPSLRASVLSCRHERIHGPAHQSAPTSRFRNRQSRQDYEAR